ncbi:hypothetical protein L218DRAFT_942590 [Marasmius fiardii PR-910]|nr:hypothetical protein L218DRAFT_942590 [Marasmius fiardii PR-910]
MDRSVLPTIRIIVSSNAEQYRVVELTGSPDGSCIRERILAQLRIPDRLHSRYSIYQSEVGAYALGDALNDLTLFDLCRRYGDSSGSLRFFVSTSPHRPPTRMEPEYPDYSIPPPPSYAYYRSDKMQFERLPEVNDSMRHGKGAGCGSESTALSR